MNTEEKELLYLRYLEELLEAMTVIDDVNMDGIFAALGKLCQLFNICKGVTTFYDSLRHEQEKKGEVFVCYDTGEKCHVAEQFRIVTPAMTVVTCEAFHADGSEELSDYDREKVRLVMRTIISLVSRVRLQRIVEKLTFYDSAGYRNIRYFIRMVEDMIDNKQLNGKDAIYFNLRHFSLVNQSIGRARGDIAIRNYFDALDSVLGEGETVCRVGGDNFIMICNRENVHNVILILSGMDVVYDVNEGKKIKVSSSAGVFEIPDDYDGSFSGIMDRSLECHTAAKRSEDTAIVFYNEEMAKEREHKLYIEKMLPEALEKEEFLVYYQPKVNVNGGELIGAEALCRWKHNGEIIPPSDFIPIMEQSMDICRLDFYMLDHVCRDIRRWLDEGKSVVRVSVNLSRKHMLDTDLINNIVSIVDKHNIPHKYIEVELTETTTDVEFRDLKRIVSGLQMLGFYTSVDDFGTGYSSLNLVKEIPWNVLKVDKSLLPVDVENEDSMSSIMFKYVVAMARELGLECITEGVETSHQLDVLKENHCDLAQGFYFDKPLPVDDFEDRLKAHKYKLS